MLDATAAGPAKDHCDTDYLPARSDFLAARASLVGPAPRRLRRVVAFAQQAGRIAEPFACVMEALEGEASWWDRAPIAACRASVVSEEACRRAYRAGQIESAREAMALYVEGREGAPPRPTHLIEAAARVTRASDGPDSTMITSADIVDLVQEFVALDEEAAEEAGILAAEALHSYHWSEVVSDQVAAALESARRDVSEIVRELPAGAASEMLAKAIHRAEDTVDHGDAFRIGERAPCLPAAPAAPAAPRPSPNLIDLSAWEALAFEAEKVELAAAIRRERLGMTTPPTVTSGLAYVDFGPAVTAPPPSWLAKGLLPRTGIGLLLGESGAGKSFAAIHSALCVAYGLPMFGARTKRGGVLYIAAEGGRGVLRRFRAADDAMAGAVAAANLTRPAGSPPLSRAPIRVVHEAPDLSRDGNPAPLVRTIRAAQREFEDAGDRLALVVIDTWHATMGGGDENSAADAGHALKPLIAESEAGDFLTLIVHHPGKEVERGARGSNALPAAADAIIVVSVPGHGGAKAKPSSAGREATVTKMRDGEAGGGFTYALDIVQIGVDEDGDPITTCVVAARDRPAEDADGLTSNDRAILGAVRAAVEDRGGGRANQREARLRFNAGRRDAKPEAARKAWTRGLERAIDARRVQADDAGEWLWLPA